MAQPADAQRRRRLAREITRRAPDTGEVGFTGISRMGGLITEEYQVDLKGTKAVSTYIRMRADAMVEALYTAMRLPIMAASWVLEPGGEDANAKRALEIVQRQLGIGAGASTGLVWEEEVRERLTYLQFGFSVGALNWRVEGGELVLAEVRPIHPRTVAQSGKRWQYEDGRLVGVWQAGDDGSGWREAYIPAEAWIHLTHDGEFDNPEGRSAFRSLYKHWYLKDLIYKLGGIGMERGAVGTPIGKHPPGASDTLITNLKTLVKYLQANETGYGVMPSDFEIDELKVTTQLQPMLQWARHMDSEMSKAVLMSWLNLGQEGSGGSQELARELINTAMLALEFHGDMIAAAYNRHIIPQIVSYNLDTDQYPVLSCTVARQSTEALVKYVQQLTTGTNPALTWGKADEAALRERLQLPKVEEPRPAAAPAPAEGLSRAGGRIVLQRDPASWTGEPPAWPRLGEIAEEWQGALAELATELREEFWRIGRLPELAASRQTFARLAELSPEQKQALSDACERYLTALAGADRSREGFVGQESEDALLQQYEVMAHGIGVERCRELRGAEAAAYRPTRESPRVRSLLDHAFSGLSDGTRLRIEARIDGLREMMVQAGLNGDSPLDTAARIAREFSSLAGYEAERLARTEASQASCWGIIDECAAADVGELEPVISSLACEVCQAHRGERIRVGEAVPGLGGNCTPYHPHCLCSMAPVVE